MPEKREGALIKKNSLLRIDLAICAIIVVGFLLTSIIGYHSNWGVFREDVERMAGLTSSGIFQEIDQTFTEPINVSLTMANDSLLKTFLSEESLRAGDGAFVETMRDYLDGYHIKYGYDSVFLVSAKTHHYYHYSGLDRTLVRGDPENVWYYTFLDSGQEYGLNIDNDQVVGKHNEITVFINCRIQGEDGETLGVVGVGFQVTTLQALLVRYEQDSDLRAFLVDPEGLIEISTTETGYQASNLFDQCSFPELEHKILSSRDSGVRAWYSDRGLMGYVVSQYVPTLDWFLIVAHDTGALRQQLLFQLAGSVAVIALVLLFVMLAITRIVNRYNKQIIQLTIAREQEHKTVFQAAAEQLYQDIYEIDVTNDRAANQATARYFESLGVPRGASYRAAMQVIAQKQIKEEFREEYARMFSPEAILSAFAEGRENLHCELLLTDDGSTYYWTRVNAHLYQWSEDDSIHILVYHQNIDAEKRRELFLSDMVQRDSLTGLYNKAATQDHVRALLEQCPNGSFVFIILDVDNFKAINDTRGHAVGDLVLSAVAQTLGSLFRRSDVLGRIGGDEFAAFLPVADRAAAEKKVLELSQALDREVAHGSGSCHITASLGAAMAPENGTDLEALYTKADEALYRIKNSGKNSYAFY